MCTTFVTGARGDQKRVLSPLGNGVKDDDELPCRCEPQCLCWEPNLQPPQEQQVLLNTETPLQLPFLPNSFP